MLTDWWILALFAAACVGMTMISMGKYHENRIRDAYTRGYGQGVQTEQDRLTGLFREGPPLDNPRAEEFWIEHRDEIQKAAWRAHTRGTDDQGDDRPITSVYEMKAITEVCYDIFEHVGVLCDRLRLLRLLEYLTGSDNANIEPMHEAATLLEEINRE